MCLENGIGVRKDTSKAFKYYFFANEYGDIQGNKNKFPL